MKSIMRSRKDAPRGQKFISKIIYISSFLFSLSLFSLINLNEFIYLKYTKRILVSISQADSLHIYRARKIAKKQSCFCSDGELSIESENVRRKFRATSPREKERECLLFCADSQRPSSPEGSRAYDRYDDQLVGRWPSGRGPTSRWNPQGGICPEGAV